MLLHWSVYLSDLYDFVRSLMGTKSQDTLRIIFFLPIPYSFEYFSFKTYFEITKCDVFGSVLLSQNSQIALGKLDVHMQKIKIGLYLTQKLTQSQFKTFM